MSATLGTEWRKFRKSTLAAWLVWVLAVLHPGNSVAQQPQSGIDPCSRAMAQLATPAAAVASEPSANRVAVSQTVLNFTSCLNRHAWDGVLALTNDAFRTSMFGVSDAEQLRSHLRALDNRGLLPQLRIQSIEENGTTGSTLATLIVRWQGWSGVHQELWRLQIENGHWMLAGRSIQSPQVNGAAVGIRFELEAGELGSPATEIANPGTVIFAFENRLDRDMRVLLLEVGSSATLESVIAACDTTGPIGYRPAGQLQIPPGKIVSMPLFDLADGIYAVISGDNPCTGQHGTEMRQVKLLSVVAAAEY